MVAQGSKHDCSSKQSDNCIISYDPALKAYSFTSTVFCWSRQSQDHPDSRRGELDSAYLYGSGKVILGFPGSSAGEESACNAGEPSSIPGSGRSPGEGRDSLLQYFWVSLVAQTVKIPPVMWETWVQSLGWRIPWRKAWQPIQYYCLEGLMDREVWRATAHGVAELDMTEWGHTRGYIGDEDVGMGIFKKLSPRVNM